MIWGTLILGGYGLIQYFLLPPWDACLDAQSGKRNFRRRQAHGAACLQHDQRAAATGYLSGPFGILVALHSKDRIRIIAIPLGVLTLIFTQARSTWLSFLVGFVYLTFRGSFRLRVQVLIVSIVSFGAILIALQNPDVSKSVQQRMNIALRRRQ